jgi:hypothetical protein
MDIFNLPNKSDFTQIFYNNSTLYNGWQTWSKPKNISFVHILCIGSGAGGGGARGNGNLSAGGGGGGGSGAYSTGIFPASLLPDTLYVSVGKGGAGGIGGTSGVNGTAGGAGELSFVSIYPSSARTTSTILMASGDLPVPTGGGGSNSSLAGSLGNAGAVWVYTTNYIFPQLGQITPIIGVAGVAGATATASVGGSITITKTVTGGAGGGGASSGGASANGGSITGAGIIPTLTGGTANSTTNVYGSCGLGMNLVNNGYSSPLPLYFTGGSGGASSHSPERAGGNGGDGAYGCGGGGGGGAYAGNGGNGGKGGDGLVIITCW